MKYQETWINGKSTGEPFQRACADRYEVVKGILSRYRRPFSVFDFGANMGYFTFRIAEDFPQATVVAVDKHTELGSLARQNGLPNVITISAKWSADDLRNLARCEAFDVVLALNVLHHTEDWNKALLAMCQLGSRAIIETPGRGDSAALQRGDHEAIRETVEGLGKEIHRSASHVTDGAERIMYSARFWHSKELTTQALDAKDRGAPAMGKTTVTFDDDEASIVFERGEKRPFVPGMNLWNAHLLGASWPGDTKDRIVREVELLTASGRWHDDLRPWNFILSGDRAVGIDIGNKKWRKEPEPDGLAQCLALL